MKKLIQATENLSLIDAIEMSVSNHVLLKAQGRLGLPHKLLQVHENCVFFDADRKRFICLNAEDYIAAYRVPKSEFSSGVYYLAPLTEKEVAQIDNILSRRFNSSLEKEQNTRHLPALSLLPQVNVLDKTGNEILSRSDELYTSDGRSSTKLRSVFQLRECITFVVFDPVNPKKKDLYHARKGDVFSLLKGEHDRMARLVVLNKKDVPAIKMQEKKEKILRKWEEKATTQKLVDAVRQRKIEKIRN